MSKLSSRVAARYMKAQEECGGPAPMAQETVSQEQQQAFPKSKGGQQMLLEAIGELQDAFDARDDDAMQKAMNKVKSSSAPGR